jgi:hypothetical protein
MNSKVISILNSSVKLQNKCIFVVYGDENVCKGVFIIILEFNF